MELNRKRKWHCTPRPGNPGRDQKTEAVLWGIDRGVRGIYVQAKMMVVAIFAEVQSGAEWGQKGTKADQNQTRNRKQQEEAEKRQ